MKTNIYLIFLVILIILYIFYINYGFNSNRFDKYKLDNKNNTLNYLNGYWISDQNFNELSDIKNLILYIDNLNDAYLLIIDNDNNINNYELYLNINEHNIKCNNNNYNFECNFNLNQKMKSNDFVWKNKNFNSLLSINDGNLKLFNNNILYADLYKDNQISSYINKID